MSCDAGHLALGANDKVVQMSGFNVVSHTGDILTSVSTLDTMAKTFRVLLCDQRVDFGVEFTIWRFTSVLDILLVHFLKFYFF